MIDEAHKCAHPDCRCPRGEESEYCSVYCQDAASVADVDCACGHPECDLVR